MAIARALAVEPAVLLLDEPLSALDLKLRQHMRAELRAIQRRVGITFLYITHDQGEALAMSDRLAVMSRGGSSRSTRPTASMPSPPPPSSPASSAKNRLRGRVRMAADGLLTVDTPLGPLRALNPLGLGPGAEALLFIRPERVELEPAPGIENRLQGSIARRTLEGPFLQLAVTTGSGHELLLQRANEGETGRFQPGLAVTLGFPAAAARALPAGPADA